MVSTLNRRSWQLGWYAGVACLAPGLACDGSADEAAAARGIPPECTVLEADEPVVLETDSHVLAQEEYGVFRSGSLAQTVLPVDGDVYWYDYAGTVFVERQGDGQAVELHRPTPSSGRRRERGLGLVANADRVFIGSGHAIEGDDTFFTYPPGRLLSIPKQGGPSEVLLEVSDQWLAPVLADEERVIVFAQGATEEGFYQIPLAAPRLEPLPLGWAAPTAATSDYEQNAADMFKRGQLVGEDVYWRSPAYSSLRLLRGGFEGTEGEPVAEVSKAYSIGPGYLLTQEDAWLPGHYYAGKAFLVRDDSGCRALRGWPGLPASSLALDQQFVYWGDSSGSGGEVRLMRVDRVSGALAQLITPGFTPTGYIELVARDETRLFLRTSEALVSVRRP